MADEDQRGADGGGLLQQQVDEGLLAFGIERRGRFVGDQDFRPADQRARGGDALLLADRQLAGRLVPEVGVEVEVAQQAFSLGARCRRRPARGGAVRRCRAAARCRVPAARAAG
jgi:hypothetical protein